MEAACRTDALIFGWVSSAIIRGFIVRFLHQMQLRQNSCHSKSIFDRIVELFHFSFYLNALSRQLTGVVDILWKEKSAAQHMISHSAFSAYSGTPEITKTI